MGSGITVGMPVCVAVGVGLVEVVAVADGALEGTRVVVGVFVGNTPPLRTEGTNQKALGLPSLA